MPSNHVRLLISRLLILFLPSIGSALCYFPDGTVAAGDSPCNPNSISTCCGRGFACLSNNICMLTDQVPGTGIGQSKYIRGSCTDKTWNDPRCPQFCVSPDRSDCLACAMGMAKCPASNTNTEVYYCQDGQNENGANSASVSVACQSYTIAFKGVATPVTTIGYTITGTSTTSSDTVSSTNLSSLTTASDPPNPSSGSFKSGSDSHLGLGLGVGLGVGLGLIAVALFALLFLRYRRTSSRKPSDDYASYNNATKTSDLNYFWKDSHPPVQAYPYEAHPRSPGELAGPYLPRRSHPSELAG